MGVEISPGNNLSKGPESSLETKELVERYLNIPPENKVSWPEFSDDAKKGSQFVTILCEGILEAVERKGFALDEAEEWISYIHSRLAEKHPDNANEIEFAGLFTRVKANLAKSNYILAGLGPDSESADLERIYENAARLLLFVQVSANVHLPHFTSLIIEALSKAGKSGEVKTILDNRTKSEVIIHIPPLGSGNPHLN